MAQTPEKVVSHSMQDNIGKSFSLGPVVAGLVPLFGTALKVGSKLSVTLYIGPTALQLYINDCLLEIVRFLLTWVVECSHVHWLPGGLGTGILDLKVKLRVEDTQQGDDKNRMSANHVLE